MKVTDDDGHEETQVITLTVDPVNDGWFSGDTSGSGAEDDHRNAYLYRCDRWCFQNYTVSRRSPESPLWCETVDPVNDAGAFSGER